MMGNRCLSFILASPILNCQSIPSAEDFCPDKRYSYHLPSINSPILTASYGNDTIPFNDLPVPDHFETICTVFCFTSIWKMIRDMRNQTIGFAIQIWSHCNC